MFSFKPHVHDQQEKLRAYHPAPAFKDLVSRLGAAHAECQRGGIAQHTDHDIPFDRLQQQLEVIPSECDQQDQNQYRPDNRHG